MDHWEPGIELAPPDRWRPVGGYQRTVGADEADRFRQHLVVLEARRAALQHEVGFVHRVEHPMRRQSQPVFGTDLVPAVVDVSELGPHDAVEQTVPDAADGSRPRPHARAERGRGVVGEVRVRAIADPRERNTRAFGDDEWAELRA